MMPPIGSRRILLGKSYETAHFVKPTWRTLSVAERNCCVPFARYASNLHSLSEFTLSLVARSIMRSVLIRTNEVLQSSDRSVLLEDDQIRNSAVTY
jgi:hypothetical protein